MRVIYVIGMLASLCTMSRPSIAFETDIFDIKGMTKIETRPFYGIVKFVFPEKIEYTVTYSGGTFRLQLIKEKSPTDYMHIGELVLVKPHHELGQHQFAVYKDPEGKQFVTLKCDSSTETCVIVGSVKNEAQSWKIRPKYGETDKYFATRNEATPFSFLDAKIEGNTWEFGGEEMSTNPRQDTRLNGFRRPSPGRRSKRSIMTECNIVEIAIVADATVWQFFLGRNNQNPTLATADLKEHYETLIGEVDLIFSCLPEDICLRVYLRDIIIQMAENLDFTTFTMQGQVNGVAGLSAVVDAASSEADINLGFTRLPVQFNNFLDQRAVVYFESVCRVDDENSAVINENHDGMQRLIALVIVTAIDVTITACTNNTFNADGLFLEVPTNEANFSTTYLFSDCAKNRLRISIEEFINESINCLSKGNITEEELFEAANHRLLAGTIVNEEHQCQLAFGLDSFPCVQINETTNLPLPTEGICGLGIFCFVDGACTSRTRVYSGTPCGPDQVCFKGECIDDFDCGAPPMVPGGFFTLDTLETNLGATATLNCFDGYMTTGPVSIKCRQDGWSNATENCALKDCGDTPVVENGNYSTNGNSLVGAIGVLVCDDHYTPNTTEVCISCATDGDWTTNNGGCIRECGPVPHTPDGFFVLTNNMTTEGSTAFLVCCEGFMLNTTIAIICEDTPQGWSTPPQTCQIKNCGETPSVNNGSYDVEGNSTVGEIAVLVCDPGYTLNGTDPCISCGSNGNWSMPQTECFRECGPVPHTPDGFFVLTNNMTTEGSTAFLVCCEGFMLNTTIAIICEDTPQGWSTPPQTCQIKNCGETPSVNNGSYVFEGNSTVGEIAVLVCDPGYTLNGTDPCISCESDGNWSVQQAECFRDCGRVPFTPDGWFVLTTDATTEGATASLVCCERHTINSSVTITCENTVDGWSTPSANCQRKSCGDVPSIYDGRYEPEGTLAGDIAVLVCDSHYVVNGTETCITCGTDGNWTTASATCIRECGPIPSTPNGWFVLNGNSTTEGATADLVCCDRYTVNATVTITCSNDSQGWSTPSADCQLKSCGDVPIVYDGRYEPDGTLAGDIAVLVCDSHYVVNGTATCITCGTDGNWTTASATCTRNCGPVPPTPNGWFVLNGNSTTEGATADLVCCDRYTVNATVTITCNNDSQGWSTPAAACQLKSCGEVPSVYDGRYEPDGTLASDIAVLVCDSHYVVNGTETCITCGTDGNWTTASARCIRSCGPVPPTPNGWFVLNGNSTTEGATADLVCCDRYTVNATVTITCNNDSQGWSTPAATCQLKSCGDVTSVYDGRYEPDGMLAGDIAVLVCDSHYVVNGTETCITCGTDGNWTLASARCIRSCGPVPSTPNGWFVLNGNSTTEGATADLVCCDRYTVNATVTITCNNDSQGWSTPSADCQLKACALPTTANGMFMAMGGKTTAGSLARLICDHGFAPSSESTTIVCMPDGNYSTPMASCITNCGITPRVHNGFYEVDSNSTMAALENATATLICCDGFIPPFGGSQITCTSAGWTGAVDCAACPNNTIWVLGRDSSSCYLFDENLQNYTFARDFCSAQGAILAQIDNATENDFLKNYAMNFLTEEPPSNRGIWIGIVNDTMWFPSGDPVIFNDWDTNTNQPMGGIQSCAALWRNFEYRWVDIDCNIGILPDEIDDRPSYALCEIPSTK